MKLKVILYQLLLICMIHGMASAELSQKEKQQRAAHHEIELGIQAFKGKNLKQGIMHYERAYRLAPDHQVLYTIAKAYDKISGKCRESLRTWERLILRGESCAIINKVKEGSQNTRKRCNVKVSIHSPKMGVSIYLDHDNYGYAPITTQLPAGKHQLELVKDGVSLYAGKLKLTPGSGEKSINFLEDGDRLVLTKNSRSNKPKNRSKTRSSKHKKKSKRARYSKSKKRKKKKAKHIVAAKHTTPKQSGIAPKDHQMKLRKTDNKQQINASLQCEFQSSEGYMPYPDCNGASLKEGDRFRVILSAPHGAYVYLFLSNSHGDRVMLFPDPSSDNRMRAGAEYVIPGDDWYTLDENGGTTENIKVIAAKKRIPTLEKARGIELNTKALATIQKMSFRGVRKTVKPAKMSLRLKQLDTVISSEGSEDVASASFNIVHK